MLVISSLILTLLTTTLAQKYYQQQSSNNRENKNYIPIVSESNQLGPDGAFSYSYQTGDGQQVEAQGYLKNAGNKDNEAEVIQGSYSYTAPDGTPITVTYIADELGFRAEGAHLPTPPPIPEAIQRSLELIAKAQKNQPQPQASYDHSQNFKPRPYKKLPYPRRNRYDYE